MIEYLLSTYYVLETSYVIRSTNYEQNKVLVLWAYILLRGDNPQCSLLVKSSTIHQFQTMLVWFDKKL